jgi:LGFP repeat/PAN domain
MRIFLFSTALTLLAASACISNRPAAALPFGPETCKQGFVWREACGPDDHVCVVPATRTKAAEDNSARSSRVQPGGGPFGIDTCKQGFVWREACGPQDHVCVPPATRTEAAQDNAAAAGRFEQKPILWDVLTQHNVPARNGLQPHETILTPANVTPSSFGRLYERAVDGQIIAQPLYVSNQWFHDKGLRNIVYVATRKNWIYAFDADNTDPNPNAGLIWAHPVQTEPDGPVAGMCLETRGSVGITATPVIDRASDTMYVVARKSDGTIWLNALDIGTGAPKAGTPGAVPIKAQVTINGQTINLDQGLELSRAALLLQDGAIFFGFSALNCDNAGWHGWVLAYRAPDLAQVGAFVSTVGNGYTGGGIWQSGNGIVGDGANIYFETGNGEGTVPAGGPLDESFIKLKVGPHPFYGLSLAGHYTVSNRAALNGGDTDLGSGGPVLLPGNRLVGGGKQGKLYVLDTATMQPAQFPPTGPLVPGGNDGLQAFVNSWHDDSNEPVCDDESLLRRRCYMPHPRYEASETTGPNIHTGPVYWDSAQPNAGRLYGMPEKDFLRAYNFDHAKHTLGATAAAVSPLRSPDGMPGTFLSISANGGSNGIIWANVPDHDGQWENGFGYLVAIDAITLKELWRDPDAIAFAKFNPPTVAGGKVFRPTFADKLIVYGPTPHPPAIPCYDIAAKYQNLAAAEGYLGAATNSESVAPDGVGHFQHFKGDQFEGFEGASLYWTPATCAHEVHGAIRDLWSSIGWERSVQGYPLTDQLITPDGIGAYNHFQNGSIYWTPLTGAHEVHGAIRGKWSAMGWELSPLGYPVSDETDEIDGSGRFNVFEHGTIHWRRSDGAITVQLANGTLIGPGQGGWDRPGGDMQDFALPQPNPSMCQQRCADNGACQAWTYGNPGVAGAQAHCWLKNSTPQTNANGCCTSGLRAVLTPANMNKPDGAVDRPGGDFYGFDLPDADHRLCEAECSVNGQCKSWAYVRPGVQGPAARCYMKNSAAIAANGNGCCVSGTKK